MPTDSDLGIAKAEIYKAWRKSVRQSFNFMKQNRIADKNNGDVLTGFTNRLIEDLKSRDLALEIAKQVFKV